MKITSLYLMFGAPTVEECPECGFDSLMTFPLTTLSDEGVGTGGTYRNCGRCEDMKR
jgi:hypothetical protein